MNVHAAQHHRGGHPAIERLRQAGADTLDPVHMHYLGALASRLARHEGTVQRMLEARLERAVAACEARLAQLQLKVQAQASAHSPPQRTPAGTTLADLTRQLAQHQQATAPDGTGPGSNAEAQTLRTELKSVRQHRGTWSRLSADRQLVQALGQAPQNAGPLNSHRLVLQSLTLMRDISPDYLHHFVTYADTLLCLDQHDRVPAKAKAKPRRAPGRA